MKEKRKMGRMKEMRQMRELRDDKLIDKFIMGQAQSLDNL